MHTEHINEILKKLNSTLNGLTLNEANNRLQKYGKNEISKQKKQTFIKRFFKQFLNVMVAILLVSSVVSITISIINKEISDLFEGFVILFIVIMNAIIGVVQEYKAEACLDDLKKFDKKQVQVIRSNNLIRVDSSELVVGDIVKIEAGNVVSADIRLIESNELTCDESSLTGESVAVDKDANVTLNKSCPLAERKNMVYSGSSILTGKATGIVVATGNNTELGKIANMLFSSKKETTPLQKSIDKIGKILTVIVLIVCFIVFSIELISGNGFMDATMISVALAVAAIPESLPAVITIIMALGVQQLAKRKCIIKHLHAVETLGSCEIICSDKTGTLTMNKMEVVKVFCDNQFNKTNNEFLNCMKNCNSCKIENQKLIGSPTEKAILEYVNNFKSIRKLNILHEIPFNSKRKIMTVVVENSPIKCYTKGAPEYIIDKCNSFLINGEVKPLTNSAKEYLIAKNNEMTDSALRVVAFAYKTIQAQDSIVEDNLTFLGFAGIMDNPRPEVKDAISKCFNAGLKPVMITGDHKRTAFAVAKDIGIAKDISEVITGEELDKLTDKQFNKVCLKFRVFARVTPEHKVRIVKSLKSNGKIVAMTGDGVNDAPSLKIADIGVGMGKSGTEVVKSVSDMLILDDNFSSIVVAVEEGRKVYNNIQKALQFLISTNCVEVFGMLISLIFFPQFTFLLPSQMLYINLVTDSLPAFALGQEKVENEIMNSPPRDSKKGLFSGKTGFAILYQSILQTVIAMIVFIVGVFFYSPVVASTMVFFTIIFMQLLHSINCKTNNTILNKNLLNNKTFNICFIITLILNLSVAIFPIMYKIFNLQFLNYSQWLIVIIASVLIVPTCELIKTISNKN